MEQIHNTQIINFKYAGVDESLVGINKKIVKVLLSKYINEMKDLDTWVLIPNKELEHSLYTLLNFVKENYKLPKSIKLFRGFDTHPYQDRMGHKSQ